MNGRSHLEKPGQCTVRLFFALMGRYSSQGLRAHLHCYGIHVALYFIAQKVAPISLEKTKALEEGETKFLLEALTLSASYSFFVTRNIRLLPP